jgi:hypothetical protein
MLGCRQCLMHATHSGYSFQSSTTAYKKPAYVGTLVYAADMYTEYTPRVLLCWDDRQRTTKEKVINHPHYVTISQERTLSR